MSDVTNTNIDEDSYIVPVDDIQPFYLSDTFLSDYQDKEVPWGYGDFSYVTFKRTYARKIKERNEEGEVINERREEWWETCRRVIEGMFTIQKARCNRLDVRWKNWKAQKMAKEAYDRLFHFKWTPPGRGLWMMGTDYIFKRSGAPLNNCAFTSTKDIDQSFAEPFCWQMNMSMLGVGVGFDVRGENAGVGIQEPEINGKTHVVHDSKEGWCQAVEEVLRGYAGESSMAKDFDYSEVREKGSEIKSFGGTAPGPEPLKKCIESLKDLYDGYVGEEVDSELIVDTMNIIGKCVVAGGIRRTAQIALGRPQDENYLDLKGDPEKVQDYRWASNNSVFAEVGMDYDNVVERTMNNGEPGYMWLENARKYGRMKDEPTWDDENVLGQNPCQPEWATVLTPEGIREFKDVGKGDLIWTGHRFAQIDDKWCTGTKEVYEYRTTAGVFYGTEDHRVVEEGGKAPVDEVEKIDLAERFVEEDVEIDGQSVVDGLMLGDGMRHKATGKTMLQIGENDQDYFDSDISNLIKDDLFNISEKAWDVETTIEYDELVRVWNREVPERFKQGDTETVCSFLRGLYSANGSICDTRVTLKTTSFQIVEDVQQMLSSLGIHSYYTTNKPSKIEFRNGEYETKTSYDLNIGYQRGRELFLEMIGFLQEYKQEQLKSIVENTEHGTHKTSYEIIDKNKVSEEKVYDLTVKASEHTYWTGGLLVSNCGEQSLEDRELCCLVETFPEKHKDFEDFKKTLKIAYLYAKTVTLVPTHDQRTNEVMLKNRRIGCSMSGIVQAVQKHGMRTFLEWCDEGYEFVQELDEKYSDWLCVRESVKTTSVKPSGTVSILTGATPGVHWDHSPYYIRRVRIQDTNDLVERCKEAGYPVEDDVYADDTKVVEFPVKVDNLERGKSEVSIWEKVELVSLVQHYWSDNQVSATVQFQEGEQDVIPRVLEMYEHKLKSISFLPSEDHGFDQPPYEEIGEEEYERRKEEVDSVRIEEDVHDQEDKFCSGEACKVDV